MTCKYCKVQLSDNAVYCHICGKKQIVQSHKHRHRAHAEGTITKLSGRRSSPYWARLPADYSTGTVIRKSVGVFPTYKDASEALAKAIYTLETEIVNTKETVTLQTIYDQFISSHYYEGLSKSAQASHRTAWKHLEDCWHVPIANVNKETFQKITNTLNFKGYKRETLAKIRNLASLLCKEAMGQGLITINYGQLVQLPKADSTAAKPFTNQDLKTIWNAADNGNKDAMTVLILIYTGMRPTELLSVDIAAHLHKEGNYQFFQTGSKTEAGMNRIIPIPNILNSILDALVANRSTGPLILAEKGGFNRLDNWRPRHFNILMADLNLTGYVPYSCRHTYADIQKRRNIAPEIMMEIMGHEDYSTTVERYQTTTAEDIARICSAVDGLERPK